MTFRVGQKVVCVGTMGTQGIDWNAWADYWKVVKPERGLIYTVRDIRFGTGRYHVRLADIVNPIVEFKDAPPQEPWFWAEAFRPVIERKTETGMAILREILDRETHQDKPPVKRTVHS